MKTETEIKNRVQEIDKEIGYWTKERWKAGNGQSYIDHCLEVISNYEGEKNALNWVLYSEKSISISEVEGHKLNT